MTRPPLAAALIERFRLGPDRPLDDFDALAAAAFRHQFERNEPYHRYCERRALRPADVRSWEDVPAVPTAAFKEAALICGDPRDAEAVFRTSGTTEGPERRGAHYVLDLALYRESALANFAAYALPDGARLRMLFLAPSARRAPDSSLSRMLDWVAAEHGAPGSDFYAGERGLETDRLLEALREAETARTPVFLLGTAFSYVHLFDAMADRGLRLRLAEGSRVLETGGLKGRAREVTKANLYRAFEERLGVPDDFALAEYGMTEMCSQFYDQVLRDRVRGGPRGPRRLEPPAWVRTRVVDPDTLRPLRAGETGLLRHFDLANLDSICAIQTEDLGALVGDGFRVLGRAGGAEARGCSIAFDEWTSATR